MDELVETLKTTNAILFANFAALVAIYISLYCLEILEGKSNG